MIIFKLLHSKIDSIAGALESQGQFLESESTESVKRSREIKLLVNGLSESAARTDEKIHVLVGEVSALLARVAEYIKQNEELTKSLAQLAKMEADLVAKRVAEADMPKPTEFDKIF